MDKRFERYLRSAVSQKGRNAGRKLSENTIKTYLADLGRIERHYGDVDRLYDSGALDNVERSMRRAANAEAPRFSTPMPDSSAAYAAPIAWYREFRRALVKASDSHVSLNPESLLPQDAESLLSQDVAARNIAPKAGEPSPSPMADQAPVTVPAAPYKGGMEGIIRETIAFNRSRDRGLVAAVRKRDDWRCQACGFRRHFQGKFIIDVHHFYPLADGEQAASSEDCICLCPNCHRLAHTQRDRPIPLDELRRIVAGETALSGPKPPPPAAAPAPRCPS